MSDARDTNLPHTPPTGLLPVNRDGFESGDRERFAPVYIGDSSDWVRPQFEVSDRDPIAGRYSLVLRGDSAEQRWLLVSNAFHLGATYKVALLFRQLTAGADFALLGAVQRYSKGEIPRYALVDGLRVSGGHASLEIGADAAAWTPSEAGPPGGPDRDLSVDGATRRLTVGRVYRLVMEFLEAGRVEARVVDEETQQVLARFAGVSATRAHGIGLYFHSPAGTEGVVQVDDIAVEYDEYELPEGTWARSPQFVAFRRAPDAVEDQGEWVGAASAMYDEDESLYKLWYRIRRGGVRGLGYGYATSRDGLSWQRHPENPVLTYDKETYSSTEKITVLKIAGRYEGWYTGDLGSDWHIVRVTSPDGLEWTQHGEVLTGGYFKDPDVVYVDGTYYMYLISPSSEELSVMTSDDGTRWEHRAGIPAPCHVHIGAYYDAPRQRFVLFQDAVDQVPCMRAATSDDGLHFGAFEPVLYNAEVGLDDIGIGVNYPSFFRNGPGHITSEHEVVMLYQARHDYHNNRPGWPWAGDGKLVLAGRFHGARLGVPSLYRPGEGLIYRTFPHQCPVAAGFDLSADAAVSFLVRSWDPAGVTAGRWRTTSRHARLDLRLSGLVGGGSYELTCGSGASIPLVADATGAAARSTPADGTREWELVRTS